MYCQKEKILSKKGGIYIHIPFCIKKCLYCDFYSISDLSLREKFVSALLEEIKLKSASSAHCFVNYYNSDAVNSHNAESVNLIKSNIIFDTIYFGGGTPSLLKLQDLEKIINAVINNFTFTSYKDIQITMEVNPGTLDYNYLKDIRNIGINRLSIGVQSFQDKKLQFLGRIHSGTTAYNSIIQAGKAGFENINIDLIYGVPKETLENWQQDLSSALQYFPEHLSCYMLSYEPDTVMYRKYKRKEITPLNDNVLSAMFRNTSNYLVSNGFSHYEVSNFALSDKYESIHNIKYWNMNPYIGFGPSANSYDGQSLRSWNIRNVSEYISLIDKKKFSYNEKEFLDLEQKIIESIMLGLRTKTGINIRDFNKNFDNQKELKREKNIDFFTLFKNALEKVSQNKWGKIYNSHFALNIEGWLYLDTVIKWFVEEIDDL